MYRRSGSAASLHPSGTTSGCMNAMQRMLWDATRCRCAHSTCRSQKQREFIRLVSTLPRGRLACACRWVTLHRSHTPTSWSSRTDTSMGLGQSTADTPPIEDLPACKTCDDVEVCYSPNLIGTVKLCAFLQDLMRLTSIAGTHGTFFYAQAVRTGPPRYRRRRAALPHRCTVRIDQLTLAAARSPAAPHVCAGRRH